MAWNSAICISEGSVAALRDIALNQTYNLEGVCPIAVREVAETVKRIVGDVVIEYKEARPWDYSGDIVFTNKAKVELDWEPKVDLEEGIRKYVEWYRSNIRIKD